MEEIRDIKSELAEKEFLELRGRLDSLSIQEETFWRQRAKVFWMRDRDMNSHFFHAVTTRRKRNKIEHLRDEHDIMIDSLLELCTLDKRYFEDLLRAQYSEYSPITNIVGCRLNEEDNNMLLHPDKAPGPDGLNLAFYHRFWDMCGDEILKACITWLNEGTIPSSLGDTNIILF